MTNTSSDKNAASVRERAGEKAQSSSPLFGFEGCGSMWSFYSSKELAERFAQGSDILEFSIEEASELDNARREELGYPRIKFEQFLDCIRHPETFPPDSSES
ncbi:MAG: hypothetical protein ACW99U_02740 [Candidatus Thorarchaeota archaeon]|jgi:hypothetical protein